MKKESNSFPVTFFIVAAIVCFILGLSNIASVAVQNFDDILFRKSAESCNATVTRIDNSISNEQATTNASTLKENPNIYVSYTVDNISYTNIPIYYPSYIEKGENILIYHNIVNPKEAIFSSLSYNDFKFGTKCIFVGLFFLCFTTLKRYKAFRTIDEDKEMVSDILLGILFGL